MPKDPYYNYGRQLFYVDQENFSVWFKEIYDHSDQYWKAAYVIDSFQVAVPSGRNSVGLSDGYYAIDDKTHHATNSDVLRGPTEYLYLPVSVLGPKNFNTSSLLQLSK
jgi:hypothetical protein